MTVVVFVPSAPFLLFDSGPVDLRAAIDGALDLLTGEIVVVGAAPTSGWWDGSVDRTPYGERATPAQDPLPLSLAVGRTLLGERAHRLWGVPSEEVPEAEAYLVVADGTAKRTEKAPGHLDPRAEGFDETVAAALGAGDSAALGALDERLANELWVAGLPAWRLAAALPGPWQGQVTYAAAPYGVGYVVGNWQR